MKTFFYTMIVSVLALSISLSDASEKVKVALLFEKTGAGALGTSDMIRVVYTAVKELNQQGGLLGKQVEIVELDNQSTALRSKMMAKKAMSEGVVVVFGSNWSSNSLAIAPILQAARIPMISPKSTHPLLRSRAF